MTMDVMWVEPTKIKVKEGLDRYRTDMGDLQSLADSFKKVKQILPGIINRNYELIDGGRRLAAAIIAGHKYKCIFEDTVDPYEMRMLELEANLHRKDYTPAEEALAIRDLHLMKQNTYGKSTSGSQQGHTIEDTAKLIGKSRGTVYNAIEMAEMIDAFPQLKSAKKKGDIKKAAAGLVRLSQALVGMKSHADAVSNNATTFSLVNLDAVDHMKTVPDKSINILLTDPIYGIDADKTCMTIGGITGGDLTGSGYKIRDDKKSAYFYYKILAKESIRFCTEDAHGYCFVGPEHQHIIRQIFLRAGWRVHVKPLIWIKRGTGQCNVPTAWPASCYEMVLYMRREASKLVKEGMPDWIECLPVDPSKKLHPYEKPVALLNNLLARVALPGQKLYDPFMGSGATIEAGIANKLFSTGCEIDTAAYAIALSRIVKLSSK